MPYSYLNTYRDSQSVEIIYFEIPYCLNTNRIIESIDADIPFQFLLQFASVKVVKCQLKSDWRVTVFRGNKSLCD